MLSQYTFSLFTVLSVLDATLSFNVLNKYLLIIDDNARINMVSFWNKTNVKNTGKVHIYILRRYVLTMPLSYNKVKECPNNPQSFC